MFGIQNKYEHLLRVAQRMVFVHHIISASLWLQIGGTILSILTTLCILVILYHQFKYKLVSRAVENIYCEDESRSESDTDTDDDDGNIDVNAKDSITPVTTDTFQGNKFYEVDSAMLTSSLMKDVDCFLVLFHASWCPSCPAMHRYLKYKLSSLLPIPCLSIDTDRLRDKTENSRDLKARYDLKSLSSIPTVRLYKQIKNQLSGTPQDKSSTVFSDRYVFTEVQLHPEDQHGPKLDRIKIAQLLSTSNQTRE